jgi:hypothetical protein
MEPSSAEKMVWAPVHLETILVPTDLRPDSKVALSFALALAQSSKLIWCFCMYLRSRILPIQRLVQGQVDYWMQREKTPSERLPVWKSNCVVSIPSAEAPSELVVPLNKS